MDATATRPTTVKVYAEDDVRRWPWILQLFDLGLLRSRIQEAFGPALAGKVWTLKWKDEDGDMITIGDAEDLLVAVQNCPDHILRIQVALQRKDAPQERHCPWPGAAHSRCCNPSTGEKHPPGNSAGQAGSPAAKSTCHQDAEHVFKPWMSHLQRFVKETLGVDNLDVDVLVEHPLLKSVLHGGPAAAGDAAFCTGPSGTRGPCGGAGAGCKPKRCCPFPTTSTSGAAPTHKQKQKETQKQKQKEQQQERGDTKAQTTSASDLLQQQQQQEKEQKEQGEEWYKVDAAVTQGGVDGKAKGRGDAPTIRDVFPGDTHGDSDTEDDDDGDDGNDREYLRVARAPGAAAATASSYSSVGAGRPGAPHAGRNRTSSSGSKPVAWDADRPSNAFGPYSEQVQQLLKMGFNADPRLLQAMMERHQGSLNAVISEILASQ